MNVLFLAMGKIDSIRERGIYKDLIRKFKEEGHNMYVISPIERRENEKTCMYKEDDVTFLRVKVGNLKKVNIFEKGINTVLIEYLYKRAIKRFFNNTKFDLILFSTPPITFANVIEFIKKRDEAKSYLLLKDIFPQNAVDLKMMKKNSFLYRYFKRKESKLYNISDYIGCMSQANVDYLLRNNSYLDKSKIEINPNSIEPKMIHKSDSDQLYKEYNIPKNKINFFYGGNLGKPQGIEFLLKCVKSNIDNNKIHFTVVGSGTQQKLIEEFIKVEKPMNLTYIKQIPKHEYDNLISTADVGLIFLDSKFSIPNFPSRILAYMESSKPILTATDSVTDIGEIVLNNNFGYCCVSGDIDGFNAIVPKFYSSEDRIIMGEKARKYLEKNYTVDQSYEIIMNHFK